MAERKLLRLRCYAPAIVGRRRDQSKDKNIISVTSVLSQRQKKV
jgi:hypothetical protein